MKTPREIYKAYKIMPNLQLHQLRVAAVAKMISDDIKQPHDTEAVLLCALFHDMGNIVKFDLNRFPEFLGPEGLAHWESVQQEYFDKYGKEQHEASAKIGREIGLSEKVIDLVKNVAFSQMEATRDMPSFERKITEYADMRVSPYGVASMQARIDEGRGRYTARHKDDKETNEKLQTLVTAAHDIEKQLFASCSIKPNDINDDTVAPIIEQLWDYQIS